MDADDPRHGTEYGYALHLRNPNSPACEPCRAAKRLANRRRRKLNTAGKYGRQRIGESILNRLHQARANGVLYSEICAASGISETTLTRIMAGNSPDTIVATRVKASLAVAVFPTKITPLGYTRRLRALAHLGYSVADFARESGINYESAKAARRRVPRVVKREIESTVSETYERLSAIPKTPTDSRDLYATTMSRNTAVANGWPPPHAWVDIDDPDEQPANWAYRPERQERGDALRDMDAAGAGISAVCRRLRVSPESLQKWCGNHNMSDLYRRLTARETSSPMSRTNQHTSGRAA